MGRNCASRWLEKPDAKSSAVLTSSELLRAPTPKHLEAKRRERQESDLRLLAERTAERERPLRRQRAHQPVGNGREPIILVPARTVHSILLLIWLDVCGNGLPRILPRFGFGFGRRFVHRAEVAASLDSQTTPLIQLPPERTLGNEKRK